MKSHIHSFLWRCYFPHKHREWAQEHRQSFTSDHQWFQYISYEVTTEGLESCSTKVSDPNDMKEGYTTQRPKGRKNNSTHNRDQFLLTILTFFIYHSGVFCIDVPFDLVTALQSSSRPLTGTVCVLLWSRCPDLLRVCMYCWCLCTRGSLLCRLCLSSSHNSCKN